MEAEVSEVSTRMCSVTSGRAERTPVKRVSDASSASSSDGDDGCRAMKGDDEVSVVSGVSRVVS